MRTATLFIAPGAVENVDLGLCRCGCGLKAPIAPYSNAAFGYVKGRPMRYRKGHRRSKYGYGVSFARTGFVAKIPGHYIGKFRRLEDARNAVTAALAIKGEGSANW